MSAGTLVDGLLGINPDAIAPMVSSYGVTIVPFTSLLGNLGFEIACNNLKQNQMAILCYWWTSKNGVGAHYVAFTKSDNKYKILNDDFSLNTSISEFLHGNQISNGFIQGWIVTK